MTDELVSGATLDTVKSSVDKNLDAIQELTKIVKDLADQVKKLEAEFQRWRKAGRFGS